MVKITRPSKRGEKEEIHDEIEKLDGMILEAYRGFLGFEKHFVHKRDKDLIEAIKKNLEWCANKTLLLLGRITVYELGSKLFYGRKYLDFSLHRLKQVEWNSLKYVPLNETNYSGTQFENFIKNPSLGAKAQIGKVKGSNKFIITSILIPEEHYKLINYK